MPSRKSTTPSQRRLLFRRKATVASVVVVTFLFLLFYNLGSYLFIKRIGRHLEDALDGRLKTAASLSTQIIEHDMEDVNDPSTHSLIRLLLSQIRLQNDLEATYLISPDFDVIVDSRLDLEFQASRGYLRNDSTQIQLAESGVISTSALHTVEGNHFKNVYAPVSDILGNKAILVLEANADFLDVIDFFNRGLLLGVGASILLLLLLVFFLLGATSLFLKTEAQLQQSKRLASMGQMAATVAHEIRNPLGVIKGTADVLRERYQESSSSNELFGFINEEIRRLNRLVSDFLSLSKEPALKLAEHDLCKMVSDAVHTFQAEDTAEVELSLPQNTESLKVTCDADMLRQVLLNLFLNAAQAMDNAGKINVEIRLEKIKGKRFAKVQVTDSGRGIEGDPNAIFEPFYTTKAQGTGLGLAVSRNIIERHGGWIEAENRFEGGAAVTFWLPVTWLVS